VMSATSRRVEFVPMSMTATRMGGRDASGVRRAHQHAERRELHAMRGKTRRSLCPPAVRLSRHPGCARAG
jgi:hypothetical protein